jgi:hypothetical protein
LELQIMAICIIGFGALERKAYKIYSTSHTLRIQGA